VHKTILVRSGLFDRAKVRMPTAEPDQTTQDEINRLMDRMGT
jgi:hypothetical protein